MPVATNVSGNLISQFWLPVVKEARKTVYPHRRKNARMKLLTLTDGIEPKEILAFEKEQLIEKKDATAWVSGMQKKVRIEVEGIGNVIDGSVYDVNFLGDSCPLLEHFPFDILNLDFSSQKNDDENERLEIEVQKLERFVQLQKQAKCQEFVLMYTTFLDNQPVNVSNIIDYSNSLTIGGWNGLVLNCNSTVNDVANKKTVLKSIIEQVVNKYAYNIHGIIKTTSSNSSGDNELFSLAAIMVV